MAKEFKMSQKRYDELQRELNESKTTRADEVAELIKEARGYGDLSENSEYDEAKNEQALLEARIAELEAQLKHVRILDESEMTGENVHIGSTVRVEANGKEYTYVISGATEANPFEGRISDESPVGRAVMGLKVGEKGEAVLPNGSTVIYTVLEISK